MKRLHASSLGVKKRQAAQVISSIAKHTSTALQEWIQLAISQIVVVGAR